MEAKIYRPDRNAMQSGQAKSENWILEYEPESPRVVDSLTGWRGSKGALKQIRLQFPSLETALKYAQDEGLSYRVVEIKSRTRAPNIRKLGYGENFTPQRKQSWTH